jgi:hypothetical protein
MMADRSTPNIEGCGIDISWAVDENRQPVSLDFVDFVRVYTGLNQKCGWLLETSTEILGAEDLHLEASLDAIHKSLTAIDSQAASPRDSWFFDLQGRRVVPNGKGIYIRKGKIFIQ